MTIKIYSLKKKFYDYVKAYETSEVLNESTIPNYLRNVNGQLPNKLQKLEGFLLKQNFCSFPKQMHPKYNVFSLAVKIQGCDATLKLMIIIAKDN